MIITKFIHDIDSDYNEYLEENDYISKEEYIKFREVLMNKYDIPYLCSLDIDDDCIFCS
jgi:hypothetical protein